VLCGGGCFPWACVQSDAAAGWRVGVSDMTKRTRNPIRGIVETLKPPAGRTREVIPLSLGACRSRPACEDRDSIAGTALLW
jgi:hypothetical protein